MSVCVPICLSVPTFLYLSAYLSWRLVHVNYCAYTSLCDFVSQHPPHLPPHPHTHTHIHTHTHKILDGIVKRKTTYSLSQDMDRWIAQRDQLSRKVEALKKQRKVALQAEEVVSEGGGDGGGRGEGGRGRERGGGKRWWKEGRRRRRKKHQPLAKGTHRCVLETLCL